MKNGLTFEICLDSAESCLKAQEGGADRVELCSALMEGGLTPSFGMVKEARKLLTSTKLFVIIRPRGGDFCYSDSEFQAMAHDVSMAKETGADGVVIGILKPDGTVDVERTRQLVTMARPLSVTFHRAFDMAKDPFEAMEAIISIGCERILTSGQESSSLEGADLLAELVKRAGGRIIIMPGGGVRERNIKKIRDLTGAVEFHFSAFETIESRMTYRNTRVFMGGTLRPPEYSQNLTSPSRVAAYIEKATV
ncbi:MAG: copper homeostasis protein CutC [Holophagales bacterium]|jgi:copper homeostasis protein|nr:copper homeostasis protein CutC [Holophagales bacterium]